MRQRVRQGHLTPFRLTALHVGVALLLLALTGPTALAENLGPGGSRIIVGDEVIGAYRLLITSSPNPAATGAVTFVIRVSDPQSGAIVRDAQVEVELTQGETVLKRAATHEDAGNEVDYAAHFTIDTEGVWSGVARVAGPAGASEAAFLQQVTAQRGVATVILVGLPFVAMLIVFTAMWLARNSSRQGRASGARAENH